jgi:glutaredoxin 3
MKVELYYRESCPYSAKVTAFIAARSLKKFIRYHDIDSEEDGEEKLEQISGDDQVPCLLVDQEAILESEDIMDWLELHEDELFVSKNSGEE